MNLFIFIYNACQFSLVNDFWALDLFLVDYVTTSHNLPKINLHIIISKIKFCGLHEIKEMCTKTREQINSQYIYIFLLLKLVMAILPLKTIIFNCFANSHILHKHIAISLRDIGYTCSKRDQYI